MASTLASAQAGVLAGAGASEQESFINSAGIIKDVLEVSKVRF